MLNQTTKSGSIWMALWYLPLLLCSAMKLRLPDFVQTRLCLSFHKAQKLLFWLQGHFWKACLCPLELGLLVLPWFMCRVVNYRLLTFSKILLRIQQLLTRSYKTKRVLKGQPHESKPRESTGRQTGHLLRLSNHLLTHQVRLLYTNLNSSWYCSCIQQSP